MKYAWYDHGVAERQMTLLRLWALSLKYDSDRPFLEKILYVMKQHAELLNSEFFYARNQNYRYHNHGLFQDIALLISAKYLNFFEESKIWEETAKLRGIDQITKLTVKDKDYYISTENSPGYHDGTSYIVRFFLKILEMTNDSDFNKVNQIYKGMLNFTSLMTYPNGKLPAMGDTYRLIDTKQVFSKKKKYKFVGLDKAGYVFARGSNYQFSFINTSLNKTHKHNDNLSFTLFYDGLEWFIDPSFYSHEYKKELPNYLRSEKAHNNLILDNKEYKYILGATKTKTQFNKIENKFNINAEHNSYENCKINRVIDGNLNNIYLKFEDSVSCKISENNASLLFQLAEHVEPIIKKNYVILKSEISKKRLKIVFDENVKIKKYKGNINPYFGYAGTTFLNNSEIYTVVVKEFGNSIKWKLLEE